MVQTIVSEIVPALSQEEPTSILDICWELIISSLGTPKKTGLACTLNLFLTGMSEEQ